MPSQEDLELLAGLADSVNQFEKERMGSINSPIIEGGNKEDFGIDKHKLLQQQAAISGEIDAQEQKIQNVNTPPPQPQIVQQPPQPHVVTTPQQENRVPLPPDILTTILRKLISLEKVVNKLADKLEEEKEDNE